MDTTFHSFGRAQNFREHANIISLFTFWWTYHVFKKGSRRDLEESDLPEPLKEHTASILGEKIARLWSKEAQHAKIRQIKPSLLKVILQCFASEYFLYGIALVLIELILKPIQPLFLGLLVRYFTGENSQNKNPHEFPMYLSRVFYYTKENQGAIQTDEALLYATCIVLCSFLCVSIQHPYMLSVMHLGMKVRIACMSLLYRKTLRMSMLSLSPSSVGNVLNLMSNDATRFDIVTMFLHYLWISPLQLFLVIFIVHKFAGISAVYGACLIIGLIPIQIFLATINKKLRFKTALKTDERVRLMNEIISGIQVIKMYAWEYVFCKLVQNSRRREMSILVKTSYIRGVVMSMIMFTSRTAVFVTLITMVLKYGMEIKSENVFIITCYYIIMRSSMSVYFPMGINQFAETMITIKRTRDYLMNEDAVLGDHSIIDPALNDSHTPKKRDIESNLSLVNARMDIKLEPSVRIIEAYAKWNHKYVIQDVEFMLKNGQLVGLIGQVGSGKSSLLHVILKELPVCQGYVSVRGLTSYACQEPWLFQGSVRQNIIFGHEYNRDRYRRVCKVCALLKDFKLLPYGDQTIVGERGISLSGGQRARINLARCIYKEADIYILDDPLSAVDTHVGTQIFQECITKFLANKIRILVTHQLQYLKNVDQLVIMEKGRVLATGKYDVLKNSGLDFAKYLKATDKSGGEKVGNIQATRSVAISVISGDAFYEEAYQRESLMETRGTGYVDFNVYKSYWAAGGNKCCLFMLLIIFFLTQIIASSSDYLIGNWVKEIEVMSDNEKNEQKFEYDSHNTTNYVTIYSILTELLIIISITRSLMFFYTCLRSSIKLHDDMFDAVVFSRMKFFHTNPSGRILNRFSKDMGSVDEELPYSMLDFLQMFLNLIAVLVVLGVVNYFLIAPILCVVILIYFIRRFYLKTSRSLKRLEGTVRSQVFSHLNASIQGLSTIRSHNAEKILTHEFEKHSDLHSSAWYLFISTARAFSLWIDYVCVALIVISAYAFFVIKDILGIKVMSGDVGLSITQCMTLTGLIPWGMRQSAEMENQMTSVERILEFTNLEPEPNLKVPKEKEPPKNWPQDGGIVFENLELRYSLREDPVLKHLNIEIEPQEKVGIVGRTGAGKSTIIAALFRLGYQNGKIIIDDINIAEIGLHDLRKRIAIIPQEPVIFTGSLRFNLDPFRQHTDETLMAALSAVDLLDMGGSRDVLNKALTEGGSNFSAGQKQLLCLARAIVRNNRILILDEATANMDAKTDALIQNTIRSKFENCTVLTIAHRLQTVIDSDRILVMQSGTVVEFDHPYLLLQNPNGVFTEMVTQTGLTNSEFLRKVAEDSYQKTHGSSGRTDTISNEEIY